MGHFKFLHFIYKRGVGDLIGVVVEMVGMRVVMVGQCF